MFCIIPTKHTYCKIMVTECDAGTYGYNCLNRCSGHCSKNSACNKRTGNCDVGCEAGFANYDCRKGLLRIKGC